MRLSTYAEVFTPDHPLSQAYAAGFKRTPGHLLRDVLRETGGRYEVVTAFSLREREELRRIANHTGDAHLAAVADSREVTISLEHLREHDPDCTRIVFGFRLDREPSDGDVPGLEPP